jgi:hypothetical protein
MMSSAVIPYPYDERRPVSSVATNYVVAFEGTNWHLARVLNTTQLLARLKEVGARNVDMARVLGLPDSRIPEIFSGKRALKLEEAVKLVEAYNLDSMDEPITPLTTPVARLIVHHVARSVGVEPGAEVVAELAADLRAFSAFVTDRQVRDSVQAADGFFQSLRIRRKVPAGAPQELRRPKNH